MAGNRERDFVKGTGITFILEGDAIAGAVSGELGDDFSEALRGGTGVSCVAHGKGDDAVVFEEAFRIVKGDRFLAQGNDGGEIGGWDQELLADAEHDTCEIVGAKDEFRGAVGAQGDAVEHIAFRDDVDFLFRRGCLREKEIGIDFTEKAAGLVDSGGAGDF